MTPLAKKVLELFGKPEPVAEVDGKPLEEQPLSSVPSWPCEHCGKLAEIEDVCPSLDGTRMLTLWHCSPCQTWGVTPNVIRQPPAWVSKREQ